MDFYDKDVSADQFREAAARIQWLAFDQHQVLREVDVTGVDPIRTAFLWNPRYGDSVYTPTGRSNVVEVRHAFGAPSMFKPSLAEVLSQVPTTILSGAVKAVQFTGAEPVVTSGLLSSWHSARWVVYTKRGVALGSYL